MYGQYSQNLKTANLSRSKNVPQHAPMDSINRNLGESNPLILERSSNVKGREISMNIHPDIEGSNVLRNRNYSQQTSISKYFNETKKAGMTSTSKRLQEKYDNFCSQPVKIPEKIPFPRFISKQENEQRTQYTQQMTASESDAPPNKIQKRLPTENVAKNRSKAPVQKVESKTVHLIGYVENVLTWYELLKNSDVHVVYNVMGKFVSIIEGTHPYEKQVFVRGNNGCVLECSYYEVETTLPKLNKGQLVACLGHITGAQKLKLYTIYQLEQTENLDIQRAIFLSQRMVLEHSSKKSN